MKGAVVMAAPLAERVYFAADYEHIGRVLAERHRVGPGRIYDVLQAAKRKRRLNQRVAS